MMGRLSKHFCALALFAALTVGWTWPLVVHLRDKIPGDPGDNYSFLWNLWWMRHVLRTPGLHFFRTSHLFYPFGTTTVDHPHTALPALIAATFLGSVSVVTAENVIVLACVFANMASMYALAWDITRHRRAAILAGVIFGMSPYLSAHLLGHFDLLAAWVLPAYALMLRRALRSGSNRASVATGVVAAAAAYTVYYYVVYILIFTVVYVLMESDLVTCSVHRRPRTRLTDSLRVTFLIVAGSLATAALWVGVTGGGAWQIGSAVASARTPQNLLTATWIAAAALAACTWRVSMRATRTANELKRILAVLAPLSVCFVLLASPLLLEALQLVRRGEYVTPAYFWRSAPRGVDLLAPFLGHPFHPLFRGVSRGIYTRTHQDYIEAVGWIGIVPLLILIATRSTEAIRREIGVWSAVAGVLGVLALGPYLTVGGFDSGLRLPAILLRFVPFVANARMPGRAMVCVFMALAVLVAVRTRSASGAWRSPVVQWLLIALVAFEYWDAPIPLTALDHPTVYEALAHAEPGAVCEVPLGIGDGLSPGIGSQDRRVLFYATIHEHPLVGGYIGRMPADAGARYDALPVVGSLLRLSAGRPAQSLNASDAAQTVCRYLVLNRTSSKDLVDYVHGLPIEPLAHDEDRDLFRLVTQ